MRTHTPKDSVALLPIPPTSEIFSKEAMVERHPNLLTPARLQWALRNRACNGLSSAVYESKSGQLLVHEPEFLRWYLGLSGRAKPRAGRRFDSRVASQPSSAQTGGTLPKHYT
jgi:hypothetical protein